MRHMAQLRRVQPPDPATARTLHDALERGGGKLHGENDAYVAVTVGSGLWAIEHRDRSGGITPARVDPAELLNWLEMYGVSYDGAAGLFAEYPPDGEGVISTTTM